MQQGEIEEKWEKNDYAMLLINNKKREKAYSIVPYLVASFGVLFNGSAEISNMTSLTCATNDHLYVLLKANRRI